MNPSLKVSQASAAMRSLEAPGRLRWANERVTDFQRSFPLAALWGLGDKADMVSLDTSEHLWNARVDPRRRTYAGDLYTHVLDRYGIVYDLPIFLNERRAGAAIAGVEHYNREQHHRLSMLTVDTHGYACRDGRSKAVGVRPVPSPARAGRAQAVCSFGLAQRRRLREGHRGGGRCERGVRLVPSSIR